MLITLILWGISGLIACCRAPKLLQSHQRHDRTDNLTFYRHSPLSNLRIFTRSVSAENRQGNKSNSAWARKKQYSYIGKEGRVRMIKKLHGLGRENVKPETAKGLHTINATNVGSAKDLISQKNVLRQTLHCKAVPCCDPALSLLVMLGSRNVFT